MPYSRLFVSSQSTQHVISQRPSVSLRLQAFEVLELYIELIAVRSQLLSKTKEIPPDMMAAISSTMYASMRCGCLNTSTSSPKPPLLCPTALDPSHCCTVFDL